MANNLMRASSNPTLKAFERTGPIAGERMSINGTIGKTAILLILLMITAGWTWFKFFESGNPAVVQPYMWGGIIGGLIMAVATSFKPTWAKVTAPIYALLEGLFIGGISAFFQMRYPGVVVQAVALTFAVMAVMLVLYRTHVIKVTQRFRMGVMAATGGIFLFYLLTMIVGFFGVNTAYLFGGGGLSIGLSLAICAIAALNLVLDFDFIERAAAEGAPEYMEWYGGFALIVTLVWLYFEILRLLGNARR
jgi:uncharacterized YccA/Bax inhibitor family protein